MKRIEIIKDQERNELAILDPQSREYHFYRMGSRHGIAAAAEFAGNWDGQINHPYRMQEVILCKFNLIPGKPRSKAKSKIRNEKQFRAWAVARDLKAFEAARVQKLVDDLAVIGFPIGECYQKAISLFEVYKFTRTKVRDRFALLPV